MMYFYYLTTICKFDKYSYIYSRRTTLRRWSRSVDEIRFTGRNSGIHTIFPHWLRSCSYHSAQFHIIVRFNVRTERFLHPAIARRTEIGKNSNNFSNYYILQTNLFKGGEILLLKPKEFNTILIILKY